MKKAYRTTAIGIVSIVAAETRGQAVARTLRSIRDANYRVTFTEVRAVRAAEYDKWAEVDETKHCWEESLVPR